MMEGPLVVLVVLAAALALVYAIAPLMLFAINSKLARLIEIEERIAQHIASQRAQQLEATAAAGSLSSFRRP